ncbi:hypothetical protein BDV30DRAFT_206714 [Aspergillus minisclerotigenes]|uniref:Uncharacterized protein n=1 Tax=Aspergillus minisclerotigenes TaxID=656917 RepID=A0A5N6JB45_9EURO|nr:hypothetical protein BDV30DRAFT_206714 [Aspergillus minisclerotigenes]
MCMCMSVSFLGYFYFYFCFFVFSRCGCLCLSHTESFGLRFYCRYLRSDHKRRWSELQSRSNDKTMVAKRVITENRVCR